MALNPVDAALWNTFGGSLFYLNRQEEAHQAFLQALKLNPRNVRTHYNLIYAFAAQNDSTAYLQVIAEGLACDKNSEYRARLLDKQTEVLERLTRRNQQRERFLADRSTIAPLLPKCI